MSYGLEILGKFEGGGYVCVDTLEHSSPTYNLGTMFRKAMKWDFKQGNIYKVTDVFGHIKHGIRELKNHPDKYRQYEPENKWGTVETALVTLESLRECILEQEIERKHLYLRW